MKKYPIRVIETSYGFVEVEANSKEEALSLAETEYWNGNVCWHDSEEEYKIDSSDED